MTEHIKGVGEYDQLNESQPIEIGDGVVITDLDAFAKKIVEANWGLHRMLSSLVKAIEADPHGPTYRSKDRIAGVLRDLLDNYHNI